MFVFGNIFIYLLLLVLCGPSLPFVTEDLMLELYSKYMSAVSNDNFKISTRRLFKRNREYEIHIIKLKEVNGYKKHNLLVKENLRDGGREYIYINNPVESKTPKAYLTFDEFKKALTDRVLAQKKEFTFERTTKKVQQQTYNKKPKTTSSYKNVLRQNIVKDKQQETSTTTKRERNGNIIRKVNLKTNNKDILKFNKTVNKNVTKINKDKEKTTISVKTVSAENNVHENNVTTEKVALNNITLHLVTNTEANKNNETEITVKSQDLDTTGPITENTETKETTSLSLTPNFEETEFSDTTTAFENIVEFQTDNSEILTTTEVTTESFKVKEGPKRKKTTKLYSISHEKRRSTLGRPLVFFGSR